MPKQERKKDKQDRNGVVKIERQISYDGLFEFIAKLAPSLLSSRGAVLSLENLHPVG